MQVSLAKEYADNSTAKSRVVSKPANQPSIIVDPDALELDCANGKAEEHKQGINQKLNQELWKSIQGMSGQNVKGSENIVNSLQNEIAVTIRKPETSRVIQESFINEMDFNARLNHFANKRKENAVSIAMETLANEQAHCTFTPRVNSSSRRNLKKFLEDQAQFLENRSAKIKSTQLQLIEKELMTMREGPKIDPKSELICATRSRISSANKKYKKEVEDISPLKIVNKVNKSKCAAFMTERPKVKSIKEIKQENEAMQKKEEEERSRSQKRLKKASIIQNKIKRELDSLFSLHGPNKSSLDFETFCNFFN